MLKIHHSGTKFAVKHLIKDAQMSNLDMQPRLLTKKWLKMYFGIPAVDVTGRLRRDVLTDELLQRLDLDPDRYKRIKIFTYEQSAAIRTALNIPEP